MTVSFNGSHEKVDPHLCDRRGTMDHDHTPGTALTASCPGVEGTGAITGE